MNEYRINKNWNMFIEDDRLFITKGADEIYYLDEVMPNQIKELYKAFCSNSFTDLEKDPNFSDIIKKLEKAGFIYRQKFEGIKKQLKVYIKYFGKVNDNLKNEIINIISKRKNIKIVNETSSSDLSLLIRINTSLKSILEDYEKTKRPHILIDLSYSNNISIGPLVYDETACLGCYVGRISKNWGDPIPPIEPSITSRYELIAALIIERLDEFITYGNCPDLINGVWSYNVNTHTSSYNKIYKLPWCPYCESKEDNSRFNLPWLDGDKHE